MTNERPLTAEEYAEAEFARGYTKGYTSVRGAVISGWHVTNLSRVSAQNAKALIGIGPGEGDSYGY
jgi:hypothetical protein